MSPDDIKVLIRQIRTDYEKIFFVLGSLHNNYDVSNFDIIVRRMFNNEKIDLDKPIEINNIIEKVSNLEDLNPHIAVLDIIKNISNIDLTNDVKEDSLLNAVRVIVDRLTSYTVQITVEDTKNALMLFGGKLNYIDNVGYIDLIKADYDYKGAIAKFDIKMHSSEVGLKVLYRPMIKIEEKRDINTDFDFNISRVKINRIGLVVE